MQLKYRGKLALTERPVISLMFDVKSSAQQQRMNFVQDLAKCHLWARFGG